MPIISVDLAYKDYCDIGVVILEKVGASIKVSPISLGQRGLRGPPAVSSLTNEVLKLAEGVDATWIFVDGPQGWRARESPHVHSRHCERALATQGKTGLPGKTKPGNYLGFISFAIKLFDELALRNWPRLASATIPSLRVRCAVESFPTSAWRALAMPPLPGKRRATEADIVDRLRRLNDVFDLIVERTLSHDELQALVSGLAGLALDAGNVAGVEFAGVAPFEADGYWREGFIVNPTRQAAA